MKTFSKLLTLALCVTMVFFQLHTGIWNRTIAVTENLHRQSVSKKIIDESLLFMEMSVESTESLQTYSKSTKALETSASSTKSLAKSATLSVSVGFKIFPESAGKPLLQFPLHTDQVELFEGNISISPRLLPTLKSYENNCSIYPSRMRIKLRSQRRQGARLTLLTACVTTPNRGYDDEMRALSLQNKQDYAALHGYHFVDGSEAPQYLDSPFLGWQKPSLLRQLVHTSEWLVWMDCDALIINMSVPLLQFVDAKYDVIISKDWNDINNGVYFVHSSLFSEQLLNTQFCFKPQVDKMKSRAPWADQWALSLILAKNLTHHMKVIPQHYINSYTSKRQSTWRPGEFVGHTVDCPNPKCFDGFKRMARTVRDFWKSPGNQTQADKKQLHVSLLKIIDGII